MSIKTKQRFGEALALALIVGMVGFLVYVMLPTYPKPPKPTSVTVRSNTTLNKVQPHSPVITYQTPPSSKTLQSAPAAVSSTSAQTTSHDSRSELDNRSRINFTQNNNQDQQSIRNLEGAVTTQATIVSTTCSTISRPVDAIATRVSSSLQFLPVVRELMSSVTNCS